LIALQGLVLAWLPRVDGVFLTEPPQYSVLRGHVANVPLITGAFDLPRSLCEVDPHVRKLRRRRHIVLDLHHEHIVSSDHTC
jgi:hypothetical protein